MKLKLFIIAVLMFSIGTFTGINLKEQTYNSWEREFYEWRDTEAVKQCVYQIQHRDTHEVYYWGNLSNCKEKIKEFELIYGECIIMPHLIR